LRILAEPDGNRRFCFRFRSFVLFFFSTFAVSKK
jgi:hypothetical protein